MSNWTLNGSPCCCLSLDLGLATTDTAVIEFRPGMASVPAEGDYVSVACDGTTLLWGRARAGREISGANDATRVIVEGPWAALESVVYQQSMKVAVPDGDGYVLSSILSPDIQLGMDDAGARRTTLQEITAIISYAAGAGLAITLDASFTGLQIPVLSGNGMTCAAAIMAMLDYHPDVVPFFSYTSGSASLSLKPMAGLSVVSLSGGAEGADIITGAAFRPVRDYRPGGVRIVYTRTAANGLTEAFTDSAGSIGTQGKSPKVINAFISMEGTDPGPVQEQQIRTRKVPDDTETEEKTNFWRAHLPWLDNTTMATDVTISSHAVTVDAPRITADDDEVVPEIWSTDPDDYPQELVDGTVQPWMSKIYAPLTITAHFTWGGSTLTDAVRAIFGPTGADTVERTVKITGTTARTKIYRSLGTSGTIPDWPATGLAAAYLAGFSAAVYEGSASVTGEAQPLILPGSKLNLSGYDSDWGSMNAIIQSASYDPQKHTVSLACGAPRTLSFADFRELQNTFKKRRIIAPAFAFEKRTTARPGNGSKVTGGQGTAMRSVTMPGGGSSASARALQTVLRKAGSIWNLGITNGAVLGEFSTVPVIQPDNVAIDLAPVTWFAEELTPPGTAGGFAFLYLKLFIDDSDDYAGKIDYAEVHLLYEQPAAFYDSATPYQWVHIGSLGAASGEFQPPISHINGSLQASRRGGPGCPFDTWGP